MNRVRFSLRRLRFIAQNTLREAVRQKIFLLLLVLAVNPLLRRLGPALVLTGSELAVIVVLSLFVCHVAGRGRRRGLEGPGPRRMGR